MTEKKTNIPMDPEKVSRIMATSLTEFAHRGYRGAKTEDIAQKAVVSKGIIFRYYKNKAHLYMATLKFATDRIESVADYSVWHDAQDLDAMIVNATKYKIQLQLQYPEEFKLLLDAYAEASDAPSALKHEIAEFYNNQTSANMANMIDPILNRLQFRNNVSRKTIQGLMLGVLDQVGAETKTLMQKKPDADLTDFDDIIENVRGYIDVLEHGFLKKE